MAIRNLMAATAALGLVAAPIAAQAAPALDRAAAPAGDASELRGRGGGFFILIIALAAIIGAIVIAVDSDDSDPVSP